MVARSGLVWLAAGICAALASAAGSDRVSADAVVHKVGQITWHAKKFVDQDVTLVGYVLAREQFAGKAIVEGIIDMQVVIPHTIAGIALLFIFGRAGVVGAPVKSVFGVIFNDSWWGIVLAMLFVGLPFIVNHCRDGFLSVDPRMESVARSLGASRLGAFRLVTLPLAWRALLSGAILTWARAISEFGSVAVIAYYPKTINTLLFEWYNFFGYTYTKPLAALLLLVALTIFVTLRAVARQGKHGHDQA